MGKPGRKTASKTALVAHLRDAIDSLRAAKKTAADLHGVRMPVEPEIIRIKRYVKHALRDNVNGLSRRPASAKRLRAAKLNAKLAKGVTSPEKAISSRENLRRWRDAEERLHNPDDFND